MIQRVELGIAIGALACVGAGLWMIDPAYAFIGIGSITLMLTVFAQCRRRPQQ